MPFLCSHVYRHNSIQEPLTAGCDTFASLLSVQLTMPFGQATMKTFFVFWVQLLSAYSWLRLGLDLDPVIAFLPLVKPGTNASCRCPSCVETVCSLK